MLPQLYPDCCAGLRSKEENMRELVRLAEVREAEAKKQIAALLDNRSNMYQSPAASAETDADGASMEQEIEESQRAKALAKKKFNKLRSVCIGAHQVRRHGWSYQWSGHWTYHCSVTIPLFGIASFQHVRS